jgi:hypothetical protein
MVNPLRFNLIHSQGVASKPDSADASSWWGVCLEAFGEQVQVLESLDMMASVRLLVPIADILAPEASMSYPQWLALHVGQ